jgi:hypothetical protein
VSEETGRRSGMTEGAEVAAASRVVVAMLEVAREQGVSKRRLAIQMILDAGRGGVSEGGAVARYFERRPPRLAFDNRLARLFAPFRRA